MRMLFLLLILPVAAYGEDLGRIFFTPEERAMLERLRNQPAPKGFSYEQSQATGYVKRKDGGVTKWVEGIPQYQGKEQKK